MLRALSADLVVAGEERVQAQEGDDLVGRAAQEARRVALAGLLRGPQPFNVALPDLRKLVHAGEDAGAAEAHQGLHAIALPSRSETAQRCAVNGAAGDRSLTAALLSHSSEIGAEGGVRRLLADHVLDDGRQIAGVLILQVLRQGRLVLCLCGPIAAVKGAEGPRPQLALIRLAAHSARRDGRLGAQLALGQCLPAGQARYRLSQTQPRRLDEIFLPSM